MRQWELADASENIVRRYVLRSYVSFYQLRFPPTGLHELSDRPAVSCPALAILLFRTLERALSLRAQTIFLPSLSSSDDVRVHYKCTMPAGGPLRLGLGVAFIERVRREPRKVFILL